MPVGFLGVRMLTQAATWAAIHLMAGQQGEGKSFPGRMLRPAHPAVCLSDPAQAGGGAQTKKAQVTLGHLGLRFWEHDGEIA